MTKRELHEVVKATKKAIAYVIDLMDRVVYTDRVEFDRLEAVMLRLCDQHSHYHCAWRNTEEA